MVSPGAREKENGANKSYPALPLVARLGSSSFSYISRISASENIWKSAFTAWAKLSKPTLKNWATLFIASPRYLSSFQLSFRVHGSPGPSSGLCRAAAQYRYLLSRSTHRPYPACPLSHTPVHNCRSAAPALSGLPGPSSFAHRWRAGSRCPSIGASRPSLPHGTPRPPAHRYTAS